MFSETKVLHQFLSAEPHKNKFYWQVQLGSRCHSELLHCTSALIPGNNPFHTPMTSFHYSIPCRGIYSLEAQTNTPFLCEGSKGPTAECSVIVCNYIFHKTWTQLSYDTCRIHAWPMVVTWKKYVGSQSQVICTVIMSDVHLYPVSSAIHFQFFPLPTDHRWIN